MLQTATARPDERNGGGREQKISNQFSSPEFGTLAGAPTWSHVLMTPNLAPPRGSITAWHCGARTPALESLVHSRTHVETIPVQACATRSARAFVCVWINGLTRCMQVNPPSVNRGMQAPLTPPRNAEGSALKSCAPIREGSVR